MCGGAQFHINATFLASARATGLRRKERIVQKQRQFSKVMQDKQGHTLAMLR